MYKVLSYSATNKTMNLRNAKCHFVSEHQLSSSITRNWYCFNYYKERCHVYELSFLYYYYYYVSLFCPCNVTGVCVTNISSHNMFKMFTGCYFARLEPFAEQQYCCINWALRQVSPHWLKNVLQLVSVRQLWCAIGTSQASHPYMIIIFFAEVSM